MTMKNENNPPNNIQPAKRHIIKNCQDGRTLILTKKNTMNRNDPMFIKRNGDLFFISYVEEPHRIWYPINLEIPLFGEDYVKSKLGVTDPIKQRDLRIEFYEAIRNPKDCIKSMMLEQYVLNYGTYGNPFYLHNKTEDFVTVFIEKGLNTLKPDPISGVWEHPHGNPWGKIYHNDTPDEIALKLYDEDSEFGATMKEKLDEIIGW